MFLYADDKIEEINELVLMDCVCGKKKRTPACVCVCIISIQFNRVFYMNFMYCKFIHDY